QHPLAHIAPTGDDPVAGTYRMRQVKGGVWVGVRIWFGPPADPDRPYHLLDRSWRWQACMNGRRCPVERAWPRCVAEPFSFGQYRYLLADRRWAANHAPGLPEAAPGQAV